MNRTWIFIIIFLSTFISLSLYAEDEPSNPVQFKVRLLGGLGLGSNEGLGDGTTTNNFSQELRVQLLYNQSYQSINKQETQVNQQQQNKKRESSWNVSSEGMGIDLGYIHLLTTESGTVNYFQLSLILLDVTFNDIFVFQYGLGVAIPEDAKRRIAGNFFIGTGIEIPISRTFAIPILIRYDIFFTGDDIDKDNNPSDAISIFRLSTGISMIF